MYTHLNLQKYIVFNNIQMEDAELPVTILVLLYNNSCLPVEVDLEIIFLNEKCRYERETNILLQLLKNAHVDQT